ncbi:hypothetical protein [Campylobacter troglodytis]|uniref:hypothetical protein n=1 Tax=Campylobacter troglodytis TaxID=654363 RepID=UPI001157816C|nr:hypothetical protein [Campylobacter troglodytis]TQR59638.1 hypothetical protein DMC01_06915 [Campylobacter troglodytis]
MIKKESINQVDLIKFFDNEKDGLRELEFILSGNLYTNNGIKKEKIEDLRYICHNFKLYHKLRDDLSAKKIFKLLKQKVGEGLSVRVYSFEKSLEESIAKPYYLDPTSNKIYDNKISKSLEVFSFYDEDNPLVKFTQGLRQIAKENAKDIAKIDLRLDDLNEMAAYLLFDEKEKNQDKLEKIQKLNEKFYKELNKFKEALKDYIVKVKECEYYDKQIKAKIIKTLNLFFDEMKDNIKELVKEGNNLILKEILKFFIALVDLSDLKTMFSKLTILPIFLDLINTANSIKHFKDNQIKYAYLLPLYKLLNQKMAMYLTLAQRMFCSHFFIINKTNIIDLSGIDLFKNNKAILDKGLGFVALINDLSAFVNFLENNDINLNQTYKNNCIANTAQTNSAALLDKYLSHQLHKSILLNYIEYPSFASSYLAEILQNKNNNALYKTNNALPSNPNELNYLVISNAPTYENAGLESEIMQHFLGYKIKRLGQNKKIASSYASKIDYSNYCIDRQGTKLCVVRLSPFVCIKTSQYNEIYELAKSYEDENFALYYPQEKYKAEQMIAYIASFFKQAKELKEIINSGKDFFEQYLKNMQIFLEAIHKNKIPKNTKYYYCLSEILLIALSFYLIQRELKNYGKDYEVQIINKDSFFPTINTTSYQVLSFEDIKINFIAQNAYIKLSDGLSKRIFLNKALKESLDEKLDDECCIFLDLLMAKNTQDKEELEYDLEEDLSIDKEFMQYIEYKADLIQEEETLEKAFKKEFPNFKLTQYDLLEKAFESFISSLFPFVDYLNIDDLELSKRLLKNVLEQKPLKKILKEELGLAYLALLLKNTKPLQTVTKHSFFIKQSFKMMLRAEKYALMYEKLSEIKIELTVTKNISKINRFKRFSKNYLRAYTNRAYKQALQDLGKGIVLNFIDEYFYTSFERLEAQYKKISFEHFLYKYDEPYAVKQKNFITYPLKIQSNFMCFDFNEMFYGGKLCTGGLRYFLGFSYIFHLRNFKDDLIKRIIYFIALDHHRHEDSLENYINELKAPSKQIGKVKCDELYKEFIPNKEPKYYKISKDGISSNNPQESATMQYELYKLYKKREKIKNSQGKKVPSAIDAYNEALDILQDLYDKILHTKNHKDDNKMRRLLECLELIGQNNIWAMYIEENDEKEARNNLDEDKKRPPYFIGRLATTIIRDGGLWIG